MKKEDFLKTVRRPYPPFFASMIMAGATNKKNYEGILDKEYKITRFVHTNHDWIYYLKDIELAKKLSYNYWKNPAVLKKVMKKFFEKEKHLLIAVGKDLKTFSDVYEKYMPALVMVFLCEDPVEERIKEVLTQKVGAIKANKMFDILNIPLKENFYKKEEYELVMTDDLNKHINKYKWILSRYGDEKPYTIEQAKKKLRKIDKSKFLAKRKKDKEELKKTIVHAKELMGKETGLIDLLQFLVYYRTQRTDIMNKSGYLFMPKLKEIAKEKNLTYKEALHCTHTELLNNKLPDKKIIHERIKDFSVIVKEDGFHIFSGEKSEAITKQFSDKIDNIKEVKGNIAFKGVIRGTAKIIKDKRDYPKLKEGDILVTYMTTPEMIQLMEKASAFVTDEGGITCHASIISREMKKPCIIGTKIVTQVFKDGDFVEVDANKGIIKKLS
ncbi:hypothetical protein HQ533_05010 [Candidatus Woesearchaeota archaeon]|nr:hypothetical protein [Candidatus Woesearchaeota archaeon]